MEWRRMGWARQVALFRVKRKTQKEKTFEEMGVDERKILKWILKKTVWKDAN
jgi:hypothetical protein